MKTTMRYSALSIVAFCLFALSTAHAADRHIKVINRTSYTLQRLYGSNIERWGWEEDILGSRVLLPGYWVNVNFDDGSDHCRFDLRAVFSNGAVVIRRNVNVCTTETWTITDGDDE